MIKQIHILVGTRPNFIKVTQFKRVVRNFPRIKLKLIHTGQHFDDKMAEVFFQQFDLFPDYFLEIGQCSPNQQISKITSGLEELYKSIGKPDLLIVPGDVNSTLAGAISANKMEIKLAHLESGLRSNDRSMPEEINRIITDEISDFYFVTEKSGLQNLEKENKKGKAFLVGNTMIDTLVAFEGKIQDSDILNQLELNVQKFVLMTIHRPSNVDSEKGLKKLIELLKFLTQFYKVVFPIHPRTLSRLSDFKLIDELKSIQGLVEVPPLGYFDFQKLVSNCAFVITDSGGIQEETTFRKIPCLTLRENTERPITSEIGTNTLVPFELSEIEFHIDKIKSGTYKAGAIPALWDGQATKRIVQILDSQLS